MQEIVVLLEDFLETEFSTVCEDDSPSEIAELLLDMWRQCCAGDFLLAINALARDYARHEVINLSQGMNMDSDDDADEDLREGADPLAISSTIVMEEVIEEPLPRVDKDGWEMVTRGKSARKR